MAMAKTHAKQKSKSKNKAKISENDMFSQIDS